LLPPNLEPGCVIAGGMCGSARFAGWRKAALPSSRAPSRLAITSDASVGCMVDGLITGLPSRIWVAL